MAYSWQPSSYQCFLGSWNCCKELWTAVSCVGVQQGFCSGIGEIDWYWFQLFAIWPEGILKIVFFNFFHHRSKKWSPHRTSRKSPNSNSELVRCISTISRTTGSNPSLSGVKIQRHWVSNDKHGFNGTNYNTSEGNLFDPWTLYNTFSL